MEGIDFKKVMDEQGITRCSVADQIGVSDVCLWKWIRKASMGTLDPAKVALLHAAIQNISESRKTH